MKSTKSDISNWDDIAQRYQDKFMDLKIYNESYDHFCKLLDKENPLILEIACGPGNITKYLREIRPDLIIDAIDSSPNMLRLAQINNPSVHFKLMDCRHLSQLSKSYDAILIGFCMPYLSKLECAQLIQDASRLLHGGGIFYFSTIEGRYETSAYETSSDGKNSLFVYYHETNYLEEMLFANNFTILEFSTIKYHKSELKIENHLIYIAKLKSGIN